MKTLTILKTALIFVLAGCVLAACSNTPSNYQLALDSWQGATMNQLVSRWGPPVNSYVAPNGNHVYMFYQNLTGLQPNANVSMGYGSDATAGHGFASGVGVGVNTTAYGQSGCHTWVEANSHNRIVRAYSKGSGCVASSGELKNLSNPFTLEEYPAAA